MMFPNKGQWLIEQLMKKNRWWIYLTAAILFAFLFTLKAEDSTCMHNIYIKGTIDIPLSCDTRSLTSNPKGLSYVYFEYHNWKGRPVYFTTTLGAGIAIMPIAQAVWKTLLKPGSYSKAHFNDFDREFHTYLVAIFLNIAVIYFCIWGAVRLSHIPFGSLLGLSLVASLASYDLVHIGAFVMHTNIINMASAIGAAAFMFMGISSALQSYRHVILLGLMVGLGILTYPAIAIVLPAYVLGTIYGKFRLNYMAPSWGKIINANFLLLLSTIFLPISWYFLNKYILTSDVYLTAQYGQFVWVLKAAENGILFSELIRKLLQFLTALEHTLGYEIYFIYASICLLMIRGRQNFFKELIQPVSVCVIVAILGVLSFNYLQGAYYPRMHVSILILAYILIARIAFVLNYLKMGTALLAAVSTYQVVNAFLYPATTF